MYAHCRKIMQETAAICLVCQRIASVHCAQSCRLQQVKCRSSHERPSWKHSAWLHPVLAWMEALPLPTAWLQVTLLQLSLSPVTAKTRRQCSVTTYSRKLPVSSDRLRTRHSPLLEDLEDQTGCLANIKLRWIDHGPMLIP